MHRSGTSFAARALQLLGVSLGDPDQLMAAGPDNPAGYWENRPIKELDDELLADLGGSWDQPPVLRPGWEHDAALDAARQRASAVLDRAFGETRHGPTPIGWKDPRLSLLLPFWRTVEPITATVVIVRDPLQVAASLERRNGIGGTQASVLWLRYLLAAIEADGEALVVDQRAFFDDLDVTLARLATHVGLPEPSAAAREAVAAHLDPALLHDADAAPTDPVASLACEVWNGGAVDAARLPATVRTALAEGWFRPPVDAELLARARAKVMKLQATLARRSQQKKALDAERAALAAGPDATSPAGPAGGSES
jgi:hypothetical protein